MLKIRLPRLRIIPPRKLRNPMGFAFWHEKTRSGATIPFKINDNQPFSLSENHQEPLRLSTECIHQVNNLPKGHFCYTYTSNIRYTFTIFWYHILFLLYLIYFFLMYEVQVNCQTGKKMCCDVQVLELLSVQKKK